MGNSPTPLSRREYQVLSSLSTGLLYKEIGHLHSISINTVKKHLKNIYKKLGVGKKKDAIAVFKTTVIPIEGMTTHQAEVFLFRPAARRDEK